MHELILKSHTIEIIPFSMNYIKLYVLYNPNSYMCVCDLLYVYCIYYQSNTKKSLGYNSVYNYACISTLLLRERLYVYVFCTRYHSLLIATCVDRIIFQQLTTLYSFTHDLRTAEVNTRVSLFVVNITRFNIFLFKEQYKHSEIKKITV